MENINSNARVNTLLDAIICDLKNYLDENTQDEYFDSVLEAAELVKELINN